MVQYNTKWPISLVYVLKPLTNLIRAISHFHSQYCPTNLLSTELRSNLWGNIFCLHIYLRHTLKSNVAYLNDLVTSLGRDLFSGSRSLCVGQVTLVKDPVTASKGKMSGVIKGSNKLSFTYFHEEIKISGLSLKRGIFHVGILKRVYEVSSKRNIFNQGNIPGKKHEVNQLK